MIIDSIFGTGGCSAPSVPVCFAWDAENMLWETDQLCWF